MSAIRYGFPLVSVKPRLGHQYSTTGGLFVSLGQLYYRINIGQSQYQDSRRSGRAIICAEYQIYRTFAYTPGIGNEGGMCWECSWCGVSTPLRSGKDTPTNGINNFFSGISGSLGHNLGYNFIKNADIQGFYSWASLGRDGFLHCIIVQFPGAKGQSLSSFLGLKWLLYGSLGRLFHFLA